MKEYNLDAPQEKTLDNANLLRGMLTTGISSLIKDK